MRRMVVASLVCLLAFPATAAAKPPNPTALKKHGVRVTWPVPATSTKSIGDLVEVRVRSERRRVKLSLVTLSADGRARKAVARRTLRNGTFRATLGAAGAYALRLVVAKRRYASTITVPPPPSPPALPALPAPCEATAPAAGTLAVSPTQARAGEVVTVTVTNTGASCLSTSFGISWNVFRDGGWQEVFLNRDWPAAARLVQPGEQFALAFEIPATATPGTYRLGKLITTIGPSVLITADVDVIPDR